MKKLILTFALLFTLSFATAQTLQYKDATGQIKTVQATKLYQYPNGETKTGQEVANDWNNYWAQKSQVSSPSANTQPIVVVVQAPASQPSAYEQAVIDNMKADTRQKNTQTVLNVVATGVNAYVGLRTDSRNERMTNAYLYNGVSNGYHPNVHGTGLSTNYVINNYSPNGNNAWSGNLDGAQPIMPQTYGWCQ